ncbi:glycoside hydrolase family 18 protein [Phaffia rhodozyma]|uniref:chitinase n=1 Tax=Phaffia rhodozyma TaxID=264483 RepID=A0A0F7SNJ0_PHARH|nr:glycoside hydrolase family 18 protein [Phaffia rhodozyma]
MLSILDRFCGLKGEYMIDNLPADNLTHILYAFANVRPETGEVHLTDSWADEQIHWEGDSWDDQGNNLYGCLKQLYLLKKRYRHLRVMLSIGGWSFSANFTNLTNATHRQTFARTAVQLIEDYGLDGLDIDWEYPKNATQASAYTDLLRLTREELDRHQVRRDGTRVTFDLSIAAPCGPEQMKQLEVRAMDQYLTFWNLMAYDFSGSWSPEVSHQSQLYGPSNEASAHGSVSWYLSQGIRSDKIVLGMPLYGRSFANTTGLGANFSGVAPGTWEAGMYDYRALPRPGAIVGEDISRGASWTYDPSLREFVSYDTPNVAAIKARYVRDQNLGGLMWWEMDADLRPEDQLAAHALVPLATREMGGIGKEEWNCLDYGSSKWDNLKLGRI